MKVLHVYRTYFPDPPGGLQEATRQICLSTQAFGVENTVFTLSPNPDPSVILRQEARVVRCRSWGAPASCDLGGIQSFSTFRKLVEQADVVHYLFPWPFADLLNMVAPRKPSMLTYISDIVRQRWLGRLYEPLMWRTLKHMDAIVTNAPTYAESSAVLSDPSLKEKIHQIPLGIEDRSGEFTEKPNTLTRFGLSESEPFILFVGVLRYYKGLHTLLEACLQTKAKIVIAGTGPEWDRLQKQSRALGLKNLLFVGQVTDSEKFNLINACRALVLPSHLRSEAYGMVLVEAAMFGKPMISCEINTGTSYINEHMTTGFVVPPEDPGALAKAMNLLLFDMRMATQFGIASRNRYEKLFSGRALGKSYVQLYEEVIKNQK